MNNEIVVLKNVFKKYEHSDTPVLKDISLSLASKTLSFVCGPSGVGKSTLLHITGLMDHPSQGEIFFLGNKVNHNNQDSLSQIRINNIGFMFQFHYLLENLTVEENILLPFWMKNKSVTKVNPKVFCRSGFIPQNSEDDASPLLNQWRVSVGDKEYLNILGIDHLLSRYPYELSGGEQQRVALARALVNRPKLLICDEPTGNLDHTNAIKIVELIKQFVELYEMTALIATHNLELSKLGNSIINLQDGEIKEIIKNQAIE